MNIEGGEFVLLGADEDLQWLSRVDQGVLEVHGHHGDAPTMASGLRGAGFSVDLRDNDGGRTVARFGLPAPMHTARVMTSED